MSWTSPLILALALLSSQGSENVVVREGYYVVRPGDTLEGITQQYLGDSERWRENWRLNGDLENPHRLRPGQVLRIYFRQLPETGAALAKTANEVDSNRPPRRDWETARRFDLLQPKDGVKTGDRSSAELEFGDATRLVVSEDSLVFLREAPASRGSATDIEIELGQADLEGAGLGAEDLDIEMVIGDATARPEPSADGTLRTRARSSDGAAQLMVYAGASALEAGGQNVAVDEGMGSSVAEGEPPSPPEKLLDAPELTAPAKGARLATPRPAFEWRPVPGFESYTVEVCGDETCGELVRRVTGLGAERWQPEDDLPVADLFWRVTAVAPSGLDGYPGDPRTLTILDKPDDQTPPTVALRVNGVHLAPRSGLNQGWILGPGARLEALIEDSGSGLDRWVPSLDGAETDLAAWQGPWTPGEHTVSLVAYDKAGNRAELEPTPIHYDVEPPRLTWGLETEGPSGELSATPDHTFQPTQRPNSYEVSVNDPHSWVPWLKQVWRVQTDPRQLVLSPARPVYVRIGDRKVLLTPDRGLWILAQDLACRSFVQLDHALDLEVTGRWWNNRTELSLDLMATDCVENATPVRLMLTTSNR